MANYNGAVSLNGLQTTTVFVAPVDGTYFVQCYLSLPQLATAGGASAVVALLKQNGSTIQTGIAGASGIASNQIVCAAGDTIAIALSSAAAPDQVNNAVSGQAYWGNTF